MNLEALAGLGRPIYGGHTDPDVTDFTTGANPRRPSGVANVFESTLSASRTHPPDDYVEFRTAAAAHLGCAPRDVLPCSGEFTGLRLVCDLLLDESDTVLTRAPDCEEYPREVHVQGATPKRVPHDEFLDADVDGFDTAILCYPNVLTGPAYETGDLLDFVDRCRQADVPVIVDETYVDLTEKPTLAGTPGVVVVRSLGEAYGLPGLRMGVVVVSGVLRDRLELARPCWGLSVPGAVVGEYCLKQESFLTASRERLDAERARVCDRLESRFDVVAETGVFVTVETREEQPAPIVERLRERGLLIRDGRHHDGLNDHLIFSLRSQRDNDTLLEALSV
jgi:threonine-phosphate decarboxylase